RFFRLDEQGRRRFLLNCRVAGLFHDIGKANQDFQRLMHGNASDIPQTLRHEHISALVLILPEVRTWLAESPELDVDVITGAVLSHHLKAAEEGCKYRWALAQNDRSTLRLHLGHPEIRALLVRIQEAAKLGLPPVLPADNWSVDRGNPWEIALQAGKRRANTFRRELRRDNPRQQLLLAVKAGVIVADSVASGMFRVGEDLDRWIEKVVHQVALRGDEIADKVIAPRLEQIASKLGHPVELQRFQTLAAEQGRRALLIAGCGSGKTLAAWKWAEQQAREESIGRVIFLYPTRGTATEGFRDYVAWAPEAESALVHGSANYELQEMRSNPPESLYGKTYPDEGKDRLYGLGLWSRRFFSATVDQFLSFMEHNYRGFCLLPALADSAVIFDEIHSYDGRMFDSLLEFLRNFDLPVLCMTATLPPARREKLVATEGGGLRMFPREEHHSELAELEAQETRLRYRISPVESREQALERALAAYRSGGRVLWVVNTVARCQEIADELSEPLGIQVLTYHSRFRLKDRKEVHARTVAAFQQSSKPAIAVTTQVCEMSLDLDADLLITEIAPVTSLVQRFGRANRSRSRPLDFRADLLWYEPQPSSSYLPYRKEQIESARDFLRDLGTAEVSQRRLTEALERHTPSPAHDMSMASRFITSGYYATPGSLREENDYSLTAVLNSDVEEVARRAERRESYDGFLVPVPKAWADTYEQNPERPSKLPRFLAIAQSRHYKVDRGFIVPKGD
ncbi:MAG TPA: CRISPR-associated helicase Cas3', partial [Nannocystis exedens]|nr:CRISPR-associated helicase Cas3' [Nannocystis exedens]